MTNITPIRKPNHKQKFGLNSYRRIARLANARVLACGDKYYLFDGLPTDFDAIRHSLNQLAKYRPATAKNIVAVARLTCQFSELSTSFLNVTFQNLNRWEACLRHRKSNRMKKKARKAELQEIEAISDRLKNLAGIRKHLNQLASPEFLLLPQDEQEFQSIVSDHEFDFDDLQKLLLRIVYWFRGQAHSRQFLAGLVTLNSYRETRITELQSIRDRMQQILRHKKFVNSDSSIRDLETDELFHRTAEIVKKRIKWKGFNRSKTLAHNLGAAIKAYTRAINKNCYAIDIVAPINLATNYIATKCAAEFPAAWIDQYIRSDCKLNFEGRARFANSYSHRRGYQLLMPWLANESLPKQVVFLKHCVVWLEKGASREDIEFAIRTWPHTRFDFKVSLGRLRIASLRLAELFDWTIVASTELIVSLLKASISMKTIDALIHCLRRFPSHLVPDVRDRLLGVLKPFLYDEINSIKIDATPFELAIMQWSAKWTDDDPRMINEVELPKQVRIWSRRLARFQTQNEQQACFPKSITKLLNTAENRRRELDYLREKFQAGQLNDRMRQRMDYLEHPAKQREKHTGRALRATQSACLVVGIEALRHQLTRVARACLVNRFNISPPDTTNLKELVTLGGWADRMTTRELNLLRETLGAHQRHGNHYKRHLKFNQGWLFKAYCQRMDVEKWLRPNQQTRVIEKKKFRMFVAHDPYLVFSMGNLFNTCLSHGGCNEMSVLANAAHANKQVIYVADNRNKIVARKLIAISREFQLLGYDQYSVFGMEQRQTQKEVEAWLTLYCLKLAQDIGVALADDGEPENFDGHFWYDDSPADWPEPVELSCGSIECAPGHVSQTVLRSMVV